MADVAFWSNLCSCESNVNIDMKRNFCEKVLNYFVLE